MARWRWIGRGLPIQGGKKARNKPRDYTILLFLSGRSMALHCFLFSIHSQLPCEARIEQQRDEQREEHATLYQANTSRSPRTERPPPLVLLLRFVGWLGEASCCLGRRESGR